MTILPVKELVLYKHGVGFFVRNAQFMGNSISLTFRQDDFNDILKSLTVVDASGGTVLGIRYQTPMDEVARLRESSINLSDNNTLTDLIRDLRGREVVVTYNDENGPQTVQGRMVGLNHFAHSGEALHSLDTVAVLTAQGTVQVMPVSALQALTPHDPQSANDLRYSLDTSVGDDFRRQIDIQLSDGEHDLTVHYVAPSPTWRVSYRVIAESNADGHGGKALLQGWGLFDNRLNEDLTNVNLTLVAGQPISFIYDLYNSRIPERKVIQEQVRTSGPVSFGSDLDAMRSALLSADEDEWLEEREEVLFAEASPKRRASGKMAHVARDLGSATRGPAIQSVPASAKGEQSGEFFQYEVQHPVTVKRGESALVPIIAATVDYTRELLYNAAQLANHPVASLRFANTTGLTLERGPATLITDNDYQGEAILDFARQDQHVYLPYAVELGIQVREDINTTQAFKQFVVQNKFLIKQIYWVLKHYYTITNNTRTNEVITIERPIPAHQEYVDTPDPDSFTPDTHRWKVMCEAGKEQVFVVKTRRMESSMQAIADLKYHQLEAYIKDHWLEDALAAELKAIVELYAEIARAKTQQAELSTETEALYLKQEQLRANLKSLGSTKQEAALRERLLNQLEASQDRLEAIEQQQLALSEHIANKEAAAQRLVTKLGAHHETEAGAAT